MSDSALTTSGTERELLTETPTRRRLLTGASGAAAAVTLPAVSGVAAAHFPAALSVDVQPDNAQNFVDLAEHDTVTVAVHRSEFLNSDGERETFDPTERPVRYRFGSRFALNDGEGARPLDDGTVSQGGADSEDALVLEFPVDDLGFGGGEETAWLYWERDESGDHGYAGFDSVRVYGEARGGRSLIEQLRQLLAGES